MFIALSTSHLEIERTRQLFEWMGELGGLNNHRYFFVAGAKVSLEDVKSLGAMLIPLFAGGATMRLNSEPIGNLPGAPTMPAAPNFVFSQTCDWMKNKGSGPWLWLESDAIPMKEGWADALEAEYKKAGKPIFGPLHEKPRIHINGTSIYPQALVQYNPDMVRAKALPFDLTNPDATKKFAHATHLIQRSLNGIEPWHFPDQESVKRVVRDGVLVFHGCKDFSLIQRLREARCGYTKPTSTLRVKLRQKRNSKTISIRRGAAHGDALAATVVAHKLREKGIDCVFRTAPEVAKLLKFCPGVNVVPLTDRSDQDVVDVNLDNSYEKHPLRREKHFSQIYVEATNAALKSRGIEIEPFNCVAKLKASSVAKLWFWRRFRKYPRPWIMIGPRSNSWPNRTIPDSTWAMVGKEVNGTCFWLGNHAKAPETMVDAAITSIVQAMVAIANADLFVGVDSGPLHIAAALSVPAIAIEQASSPDLHLSRQRDFKVIRPANLKCLNCQPETHACPITPGIPPCQFIDPLAIISAINRRLWGMNNGISAVVPIWKPPAERLNACLSALLGQVDQIVVTRDAAGIVPAKAMQHPKIEYVTYREKGCGYSRNMNSGFGHTDCNWVVVTNDDVVLDHDAVAKMMEVAKRDKRIGIVGNLLWYPGREKIQHAGCHREPGHIGFGHEFHNEAKCPYTEPRELECVTGACNLVRRHAFYNAGAYDEFFTAYYEDTAFALQLRQKGWKIFMCPASQGVHNEHSSTKLVPNMAQQVERSRVYFTEKWGRYFTHNKNPNVLGNFNY